MEKCCDDCPCWEYAKLAQQYCTFHDKPIDINNKHNELIKALTECDREKYPNIIGAILLDVKD